MIDDEKIIEMFFERSEQAVRELDNKYGKICHHLLSLYSKGYYSASRESHNLARLPSRIMKMQDLFIGQISLYTVI